MRRKQWASHHEALLAHKVKSARSGSLYLALFCSLALAAEADAQSTATCSGILLPGNYADVFVDGASCTIGDGVVVNGAVLGTSGFGELKICGDARVFGGVKITQGNGDVVIGNFDDVASAPPPASRSAKIAV